MKEGETPFVSEEKNLKSETKINLKKFEMSYKKELSFEEFKELFLIREVEETKRQIAIQQEETKRLIAIQQEESKRQIAIHQDITKRQIELIRLELSHSKFEKEVNIQRGSKNDSKYIYEDLIDYLDFVFEFSSIEWNFKKRWIYK